MDVLVAGGHGHTGRRLLRLLAGMPILAAVLLAAPAGAATLPTGPAGTKFYTPPKTLPARHGTPIRARRLTGKAVLKSAGANRLFLYTSTSVAGRTVAVSGTVAVPKGVPPKGGWPVISWAHGTTGIADRCAMTRADVARGYDRPLLNRWLEAGYAVVRTDYEGLGTPGDHPYLIGESEARSVLDATRAAHRVLPGLSRQTVVAGHSQGGQAALWAASRAKRWTPELLLEGTVALAPISHLGEQAVAARALTSPGPLSGLVGMIARGLDIGVPGLDVPALLGDQAKALYPRTDTDCLPQLASPAEFGALAPGSIFRPDVPLDPVVTALNANDAESVSPGGPVLIEQGTADGTVLEPFTDQLAAEYTGKGLKVTYKTYDGVTHEGVVTSKAPADEATRWIQDRLG